MSDRGPRPPRRRQGRRLTAAAGVALAAALALTGCGGGGDKKSGKAKPPPPPSTQPEAEVNAAPGSLDLKSSAGLRKPVTYDDKITVKVGGIRYVKNKVSGPGQIAGRVLTIFTLSFSNGSAKPLDLNQVRVVARYGPGKTEARPTSYANINDFYGSVPPGKDKRASYAFDIPTSGYKSVSLGVKFDARHKAALFVGTLHP
ncbi:hypothetical protein [Actinomadura litoris]|uniref:hypothetical protein n=1 Tax=Actinomadura litoris TaxID=2678616 RepID=UPI001FA7BADF|nr:hypothetical protein [Actinomadura litoris]